MCASALLRRRQCDQMVRLFFNIWQYTAMIIYPIALIDCLSTFKTLPNIKLALKKLAKDF